MIIDGELFRVKQVIFLISASTTNIPFLSESLINFCSIDFISMSFQYPSECMEKPLWVIFIEGNLKTFFYYGNVKFSSNNILHAFYWFSSSKDTGSIFMCIFTC